MQRKACACGGGCPRCSKGPAPQAKSDVSQPGDALEREADAKADEILRSPAKQSPPRPGAFRSVQGGSPPPRAPPAASAGEIAQPALGAGRPLEAATRAFFEPRFDADLSAVRVHTGAAAERSADSYAARAFTLGGHIVFNAGEYAPHTSSGQRLIAHELAHVQQQARAPAVARRVMRTPYPGCDRRTTGVDDADARLDSARDQALRMVRAARAAFPRMNSRTIRLVHRHFHCPSNSDIRTIMKGFADIEAAIPTLTMQCVPGSTAFCQASGFVRGQVTNGVLEVCPASFRADARAYRLAGTFIHAGAVTSGLVGHECLKRDPCYDDFTVPAGDMVVGNPYSYTWFAIELAGNDVGTPLTIPCAPHVVAGENVDVPPGAATDPTLIRPHTGFDTPPAGSVIVQVYEDIAGNRFIYRDGLPGSSQYMSGEHMRYYFPRSRTP